MSGLSIKRIIPAVALSLLLVGPAPVLADVSATPQAAANAGIQYLAANQGNDGSISGFGGESEWSVEAIAAAGQNPATFARAGGASLLDFIKTDVPAAGASVTALERNIIAIAAGGQDPANFGGVNYDALLESQHTGGQIGDPTLLNDDIFGIIAIDAAHATQLQAEAQDGLNYLLANQGADGGFSYTTTAGTGSDNNDTAAAIVAMYAAQHLGLTAPTLDAAKNNALAYLLSTQQTDGGFAYDGFSPSDGDSTAWSLMALNTIGSSVSAQALLARNYLLANQNPDGGFSYGAFGVTNSDTYSTAHAVIALLGTTWLLRPAAVAVVQPAVVSQSTPPPSSGSASGAPQVQTAAATAATPVQTAGTTDVAPDVALAADDTTAATPPAATATVPKPNKQPVHTFANTVHKAPAYTMYGVGILILAALIWLVLEFSEKTEGQSDVK